VVTGEGRSFKEVVAGRSTDATRGKQPVASKEDVAGGSEVVWEVEVEEAALTKLKGSYVGFLSEARDLQEIQRHFVMDGYQNLKSGFFRSLEGSDYKLGGGGGERSC
jgi:hypothetical protein